MIILEVFLVADTIQVLLTKYVIQKITIQTTGNATDFGDLINGYG